MSSKGFPHTRTNNFALYFAVFMAIYALSCLIILRVDHDYFDNVLSSFKAHYIMNICIGNRSLNWMISQHLNNVHSSINKIRVCNL